MSAKIGSNVQLLTQRRRQIRLQQKLVAPALVIVLGMVGYPFVEAVRISFTDKMNVLALLAAARLDIDVIVSERSDPRHHSMGRAWSLVRARVYPWCRCLVVQTDAVRAWGLRAVSGRPVVVIPNAVSPSFSTVS